MNLSKKRARLPQPETLLPGDVVYIFEEEEKYEALKTKTFVIGKVLEETNEGEEKDRIYGLKFFNGKELVIYPDGENAVSIFTKREYVELEKRIENGESLYYQRNYPIEEEKGEKKGWLYWVMNFLQVLVD